MSTFYTLQDLKNAYPTGTKGTYLVIENNSLYAYENGNWTNKGPDTKPVLMSKMGLLTGEKRIF